MLWWEARFYCSGADQFYAIFTAGWMLCTSAIKLHPAMARYLDWLTGLNRVVLAESGAGDTWSTRQQQFRELRIDGHPLDSFVEYLPFDLIPVNEHVKTVSDLAKSGFGRANILLFVKSMYRSDTTMEIVSISGFCLNTWYISYVCIMLLCSY